MQREETPQFSRRDGHTSTVELRGECPREIVGVLDAVSIARDKTRTQLVNEILGEWAAKVRHETNLVQRVLGGNPLPPDAAGEVRR